MSNTEHNEQTGAKKVSLQEAMQQMLANKKQGAGGNKTGSLVKNTKAMKSQQTKKANNQRRRTGV